MNVVFFSQKLLAQIQKQLGEETSEVTRLKNMERVHHRQLVALQVDKQTLQAQVKNLKEVRQP
jgi:hypothetical protein